MKSLRFIIFAAAASGLSFSLSTNAAEWKQVPNNFSEKNQLNLKQSIVTSGRDTSTTSPKTVNWEPIEGSSKIINSETQWESVPNSLPNSKKPAVIWTQVNQSLSKEIEDNIKGERHIIDPQNALVEIQPPVMPSGTTFANDKAIWRNDTWHPQISGTVPIGFGPTGLMVSTAIWGIDCVTGAGYCTKPDSFDEYLKQIENDGEAQYNLSIGFGDTEKLAGVTITTRFEETSLAIGKRNKDESKNIFSNYYIGAHLSRSFSQDTAAKIGIDNWLDVRECVDCGFAKSAYAVISQRFRLRENQNTFMPNLYLTLGIGNGRFRPLEELVRDGTRKQREAGCATPGFTPDKPCDQDALTRSSLRARELWSNKSNRCYSLRNIPWIKFNWRMGCSQIKCG